MSSFAKGELIYEGKAKRLYKVSGKPELLWQEFKNSLTAFDAQKRGSFDGKGQVNRNICSYILRHLRDHGVATHWIADIGDIDMITEKLEMLKVEVIVRNVLAGSTAKKFGIAEGSPLVRPLTEFFYKDDALHDPFISDEQALMLKIVPKQEDLETLKRQALKINEVLVPLFRNAGIQLVDFKVEFGRKASGEIVLADEISPDSCRLWDLKTGEKLDKDRFRRDLGNVAESYQEVWSRLQSLK